MYYQALYQIQYNTIQTIYTSLIMHILYNTISYKAGYIIQIAEESPIYEIADFNATVE